MKAAPTFILACCALVASTATRAHADIDPLTGIDFVTVGSAGNAAWQGNGFPLDQSIGRGSVGYEYRIGKYEVTTSQWVEFLNAAFDRPSADWIPNLFAPSGSGWAAIPTTPNTPGGRRWIAPPGSEMQPVGATDWRSSAIYCNWLHNNKGLAREAFLGGAYEVSTFGYVTMPNGVLAFTDQYTRSPGAKYFVPTLDEWIKAAHYDPAKQNPNGSVGGYWLYSNTSDTPFIGASPSAGGTANFGFIPGALSLPLGAYATVRSPWGLYDAAGASTEWLEGVFTDSVSGANYRLFDGSGRGLGPEWALQDTIYEYRAERPNLISVQSGFRVGAIVPAPATLAVIAGCLVTLRGRRGGALCPVVRTSS